MLIEPGSGRKEFVLQKRLMSESSWPPKFIALEIHLGNPTVCFRNSFLINLTFLSLYSKHRRAVIRIVG